MVVQAKMSAENKLLFMDTSGYPLPGTIVVCLLCAKPFLMPKYSGTPDQICGECFKTYADAATVVCQHCKVAICKVVPKVLDNGFTIKPRMTLHSDACNICRQGLAVSNIVEIDNWQRYIRGPKIFVPAGVSVRKVK